MTSITAYAVTALVLAFMAWKFTRLLMKPVVLVAIVILFYTGLLPATLAAVASVARTTVTSVAGAISQSFAAN